MPRSNHKRGLQAYAGRRAKNENARIPRARPVRSSRRIGGRAFEDGVMLLAGLGAGLAAMYLLDPNSGRQRRDRLVRSAGNVLESAGSAAGGAWNSVAGRAAQIGSNVKQRALDTGASWMTSAQELLPQREPEHHYLGQTACALGSMALGAGLTYVFDPDVGAHRRERISRTIAGAISGAGEMFSCAVASARQWIRDPRELSSGQSTDERRGESSSASRTPGSVAGTNPSTTGASAAQI